MKTGRRFAVLLKLVWQVDKTYFALLVFSALTHSGQVLANVMLPPLLIDALLGQGQGGDPLFWVAAIALTNLLFALLKRVVQHGRTVKESQVYIRIDRAFADKLMSIPFHMLEDPYYLDLRERASFAIRNQSATAHLVTSALDSVNQLVTVASLVVLMLRLGVLLVIGLLLCVGLMLLIQSRFSIYQQRFFAELLPVNRRYGYYAGQCFQPDGQKDFRLYGMATMLGETVKRYNHEINTWFGAFYRKSALYLGFFQVVIVLQTALAYAYVGSRALDGAITVGGLTLYVSAAISFSSAIIALGQHIIDFFRYLNFLEPLAKLMDIPDAETHTGGAELGTIHSVRFEEVSFRYPKSDALVLDQVSFDIKQGERVSIVGRNGAGKITIVKLLCRLYEPTAGRILINDTDIRDYDLASLRRQLAAVFQDFRLFHFSIEENITCAPVNAHPELFHRVIHEAGIAQAIADLPKGKATLFGKSFDENATEFSGGQAQKVALARALYKDASLLILDEPTSALDPMAEAAIYEQMNHMARSRTVIFISHRMSSSVFCNRILVLDEGKVQAFDTHQQLMKDQQGLYYTLFESQAAHYRQAKPAYL